VLLRDAMKNRRPFFIAEFKRKSPSEGWINEHADLVRQVRAYADAGAGMVSVLTDGPFFGGSYDDLDLAARTLAGTGVLVLQKEFILDPIQIYLARLHGADAILLIAALLEPHQLEHLRQTALGLGMDALVEVHDSGEYERIRHLPFPVLGVNNRDLHTFRTNLNRVNTIPPDGRLLVSESGVRHSADFQVVRRAADGFLIGTGLMRETGFSSFEQHFAAGGKYLFKACGLKEAPAAPADFYGYNFSHKSKRRVDESVLKNTELPPNAVAVFYQNTENEIREVLRRYPFPAVQLYAGDVTPGFVRSLKTRVLLAQPVRETGDLEALETFAPDVDLFILDGATPGSGARIEAVVPLDFPYPFLLAGGINAGNLDAVLPYQNCIGVDVASGIETGGRVDVEKMHGIQARLNALSERKFAADAPFPVDMV
jgi:indole-3-glycerol phosphate synthase/phosphoribosylanthranilate isomerase